MSWLNNFKIVFKISLIVALLAIDTIGTAGFAALRMMMQMSRQAPIIFENGPRTFIPT